MRSFFCTFGISLMFSLLCAGKGLLVLCTIPPQVESVRRVGGELVDVRSVVPQGASPETYSPTAREVAGFSQAKLLFLIGAPMEKAFAPRLAKAFPSLRQIDTTCAMEMREGDPHCWLGIENMVAHTYLVCKTLAKLFPGRREELERNAELYVRELQDLEHRLSADFRERGGQEIVVWHPAYGYFLEPYRIGQIAVEEEGKSPGARHFVELKERTAGLACRALFAPLQANPRQVKSACKTLNLKRVDADVLPEEYLAGMLRLGRTILSQLPQGGAR